MQLVAIYDDLVADLDRLRFGAPVHTVYNPLVYARAPFRQYLERFGRGAPEALLVGMNPGPWGMAQTGVPFGDVALVRDWMGIEAPVERPSGEHHKRPVQGFSCRRREVSGSRLWGWARDRFGEPEAFFARFFVVNYCPLCFFDAEGRNLTPDKLRAGDLRPLSAACDRALARVVRNLQPRTVVGIGVFAEKRARAALAGTDLPVGRIPHPSPASPLANRGWAEAATAALRELGIVA